MYSSMWHQNSGWSKCTTGRISLAYCYIVVNQSSNPTISSQHNSKRYLVIHLNTVALEENELQVHGHCPFQTYYRVRIYFQNQNSLHIQCNLQSVLVGLIFSFFLSLFILSSTMLQQQY